MSTNNSQERSSRHNKEPDSHRSILKSTSILSLGTFTSRLLGFVRDVILAGLFGTSLSADAFFAALKVPNLLRSFMAEGAVNSSVVPVFSAYLEKEGRKEFWNLVNVVLAWALIILSTVTLIGIAAAPLIVKGLFPGFIANPEKLRLTIYLTRILFPYLVFIGVTSYSIGVLFAFRSFLVPAFVPCFFNIAVINGAFWGSRHSSDPVLTVALSVLVGGVLQILVQIRPLKRIGFHFSRPKTLKHPAAVKIGRLLIPRIFGSAVYQFTVLIDTFCASLSGIIGAGGISAIYYSTRVIQLPVALFGFSLSSALLPSLSSLAAQKNTEQFKKTLIFSLENIFFIMCPVTVIFILFAHDIVRVLFQRGEFGAYSTQITSAALLFYSIGLFAFAGVKILVTAFHSLQDTKTPVKMAFICLLINTALNFILMFPMKIAGITFASSISQIVNLFLLLYFMHKKIGGLVLPERGFFIKITAAAFGAGAMMAGMWEYFPDFPGLLGLPLVVVLGIGVYLVFCALLRVKQARQVVGWIGKKRK